MFIPFPAAPNHNALLLPRATNDDGTANSNLSNGAIIVIVLVASGFAVVMGFAITRFFFTKEDEEHNPFIVHDEQMQYMHGLRRRNLEDLKHTMGVQVSHYQPNDIASSDFSVAQSSRATSQALSP
jgi:hypothetical protein